MILKFTYYGDPILRKKTAPVTVITDEIKKLVADMIETIVKTKNAVGLAAPQVSHSIAVFVVQFPDKDSKDEWIPGEIQVFINPKILAISDEEWDYTEGCLSIPTLYEDVRRPVAIRLQAQDLDGNTFVKEYTGYEARMILHENDHLNGVLFIDRVEPSRRKLLDKTLREIKNKYYLKKK